MSEQITKWPDKCPITRRDFFMEIDGVPTYGGPYDSYTIPEMTGEADQPFHDRELFVRRYDHDCGGWVEDEFIPFRVIHEDVLMELEEALPPPVVTAQAERSAFDAWLQEGIDGTDTARPRADVIEDYFAVWLARATLNVATPNTDLELALFAENQKRQQVEQQRGRLLAVLELLLCDTEEAEHMTWRERTEEARSVIAAVRGEAPCTTTSPS